MSFRTESTFRGLGSILDIMPEKREKTIFRIKIDRLDEDIDESAWRHVGESINKAISECPYAKKEKV